MRERRDFIQEKDEPGGVAGESPDLRKEVRGDLR
jgi:hypothetical protein